MEKKDIQFSCKSREVISLEEFEKRKKSDATIELEEEKKSSALIESYNSQVENRFHGNWAAFFLDFERKTFRLLNEIKKQNENLAIQNKALYEQNATMERQIAYMEEREHQRELEEVLVRLRKEKRKKTKKLPLRDAITREEFAFILQLYRKTYKNPLMQARCIIAATLLYATGLRISNLLLLRRKDLDELLNKGQCPLPEIKGGDLRKTIYIGSQGQQALKELMPHIYVLYLNQPNENLSIFSGKSNAEKAMSKRNFNIQINAVLRKASVLLGKHIRSHSFRATFATDLLDAGLPIEKAKDIIGHAHIGTTAVYRRSRVSFTEFKQTIRALNKKRELDRTKKKNLDLF